MFLIALFDISDAPMLESSLNGAPGDTLPIFCVLAIVTLILYLVGSSKLFRLCLCILGIYVLCNLLAVLSPELWVAISGVAGEVWALVKSLIQGAAEWRPSLV